MLSVLIFAFDFIVEYVSYTVFVLIINVVVFVAPASQYKPRLYEN